MLSALLWLEWRRVRSRFLRVSLALVLIPLLLGFLRRGHGGIEFSMNWYNLPHLLARFIETILPLAWFLVILVFPARQIGGDRVDGTARFLLDRPVPRSLTWSVRVGVSLGAVLATILLSATSWILARLLSGTLPASSLRTLPAGLLEAPPPAILLPVAAFLAAFSASVLYGSLHRAGLAIIILVLFAPGMSLRWLRSMIGVSSGWVFCLELFAIALAFLAGSFAAETRGEPAGRHRVLRGSLTFLLVLALASLAVFLVGLHGHRLYLRELGFPPEDPAATRGTNPVLPLANADRGAWLVDRRTGKRLAFLEGAIGWSFSPDGGRLVVLAHAGEDGSPRLELRDGGTGEPLRDPLPVPGDVVPRSVTSSAWQGDRVFLGVGLAGTRKGVVLEANLAAGSARVVGRVDRDPIVVRPGADEDAPVTWTPGHPLPGCGTVECLPGRSAARALSPTRRWWLYRAGEETWHVVELATGRQVPLPGPPPVNDPAWVLGDRVAWMVEGVPTGGTRLLAWAPGDAAPRQIRVFPGVRWGAVTPDPRGGFLVVRLLAGTPKAPVQTSTGVFAWNVRNDTWITVPGSFPPEDLYASWTWAAPGCLVLSRKERYDHRPIVLIDLERDDPRPVFPEP